LNYDVPNNDTDRCYSDETDRDYCATYGRLYNWETAKTACPSGWHLPIDAEWTILVTYVGGETGAKLKATSDWYSEDGYITGIDSYGSALPGGNGYSDGSFLDVGGNGFWWTGSEYDSNLAYNWGMYYYSSDAERNYNTKTSLFSVRCVKDN